MLLVSHKHKALLVPDGAAIENLWPDAPTVNGRRVIPHDLRNMFLLRHHGYPATPNPIRTQYDWPHPPDQPPFEVQIKTGELLTGNVRAYCLNDLGTGKTRSALWAWDYLHGNNWAGKLIVACKMSTMHVTWAAEVTAVLPHRKAVVLYGTKEKRLKLLADPDAEIFIINHDGLKVIREELSARSDIDCLVIDELATFRNYSSAQFKAMRKFAERFAWVWGMTGRPMPRSPTDVWAQCRIITPHTVPKFYTHARDMLMQKLDTFTWVSKPDATEKAFTMMQPSVRYTLDDVTELPDCVIRPANVPLSTEQDKLYKALASQLSVMVQNQQITAMNAAAAMNKLLQVAIGWVYTNNRGTVEIDSSPRLQWLQDTIDQAERKVIVFVPYRHAVEGLAAYFSVNGGEGDGHPLDYAMVHGGVSEGKRTAIFNAFQNTPEYKVLLAHPVCMAHGLTLTAADTIIWYCPTISLEVFEQANARIRRVGQNHRQQILLMQGTPVERRIYTLLRRHQTAQDKLLAMFEEATQPGEGP